MSEPVIKGDASTGFSFSWLHEHPKMTVSGSVDFDGNYSVSFTTSWTDGSSFFNYSFKVQVDGGKSINFAAGSIKKGTTGSCSGTLSGRNFKVIATCGDTGCGNGAAKGKILIDKTLNDPYTAPSWGTLSVEERTTKSIKIKATWNDVNNNLSTNDADAVIVLYNSSKQEIKRDTAYSRDGSSVTFDNLSHNTTYYYNAYLTDAANGGSTSSLWYDPGYLPTSTKKLGCTYDTTSAKQYSISANFYATVDDAKYPTQSGISCSTAELQNSSGTWLENLTTFSGTYGTISASGLTSYTTYKLKCSITDGSNTVSNTVSLTTIFPYARIKVNGVWKKAMPYVNVNGYWKLAKPYVKNSGGEWKECNGED